MSILKGRRGTAVFKTLLIGLAAFILVWLRVLYGSWTAYEKGEDLFQKGQYTRAITFFDRSLHWYTPFNPYVARSTERLWEISSLAQGKGDVKLAIIALESVQQGYYGAESFYGPGRDWIERCRGKIEELERTREQQKGIRSGPAWNDPKLFRSQGFRRPDIFWSIVTEIGFLGWIGSIVCFIVTVFKNQEPDHPTLSGRLLWGGSGIIFFTIWVLGMMWA